MGNSKASIVIATYNRAADLERCLDSLLNQQGCAMEIIVVDDASTDHTCEMIREKYQECVALVSRNTNCGSIKNRNYGASLAVGDILFLIDDDTEFPGPDTVKEVVEEFENPRVGAVAIPYYQDGELKHAMPPTGGEGVDCVVASYIGCASAVRRSTFMDLGGYEEFFHHGTEEDDFCIRMMNQGNICKIGQVSEPMVHYASPIRNYQNWDYYGRRSTLLYIWKNCPSVYFVPNLFITTLRGLQHAFRIRRFRGNLLGLFHGYGAILKSIVGRGCKRQPVRKEIYAISLKLRKAPLPLCDVEAYLL